MLQPWHMMLSPWQNHRFCLLWFASVLSCIGFTDRQSVLIIDHKGLSSRQKPT